MKTQLLFGVLGLLAWLGYTIASSAQVTPQPDSQTGMEGTIVVSPVSAGPTRQGQAESKPLANTAFAVKQGDRVVTTFVTDNEGRFRVSLPKGHYTVARKEAVAMGFFGPFDVDVTPGRMKTVQWKCDTGIR